MIWCLVQGRIIRGRVKVTEGVGVRVRVKLSIWGLFSKQLLVVRMLYNPRIQIYTCTIQTCTKLLGNGQKLKRKTNKK